MLESTVIKETDYQPFMNWKLVEQFAEGIPFFSENDPNSPEWRKTPILSIDLTNEGYTVVQVKNEADKSSNPTQTIKDRASWELTTLYRDFARTLHMQKVSNYLNKSIDSIPVPRLSIITSGNAGRSLAKAFEKYNLPPIKIIVDNSIPEERLDILKDLYADIYQGKLSNGPLSTEEIKQLTNNANGVDITSVVSLEPQAVFYDWHVHETFNEAPNSIFVPYGSGRLWENYLTWQQRTVRNFMNYNQDPRLDVSPGKVTSMNILGAEPIKPDSAADKLTKTFHPFAIYNPEDAAALTTLSFSGDKTGIYQVPEEYIQKAYKILSNHMETEHSGAAGLALYMHLFDQGKVNPNKKHLIINTGKGI